MNTIVTISLILLVIAAMLYLAWRGIMGVKDSYLESTCRALEEKLEQILEETGRNGSSLREAQVFFDQEADKIILAYCLQAYGDVENTPLKKQVALRNLKFRLKRSLEVRLNTPSTVPTDTLKSTGISSKPTRNN